MRRVSTMVAGMAIVVTLTGVALTTMPAAAATGPDHPAAHTTTRTPAKSGDVTPLSLPPYPYFYIWDGTYRTGRYCSWHQGTADAWYGDTAAHGGGNCNDMATSLLNNSYEGGNDDVLLYKDINFRSFSLVVLCRGDYLQDMSRDYWSDGTVMNNSASSHAWGIISGCD